MHTSVWAPPQEPGLFEADVVMAQLRYSGLLETVRIRKEGFPVRLPFQVFIDRYLRHGASFAPQTSTRPARSQEHSPGRAGLAVPAAQAVLCPRPPQASCSVAHSYRFAFFIVLLCVDSKEK